MSADLTPETLDLLAELREVGTPGPWEEMCLGSEGYTIIHRRDDRKRPDRIARFGDMSWDEDRANAELIVAAVNALLGLVEEVRRLRHRYVQRDSDAVNLASIAAGLRAERDRARDIVVALESQLAKVEALHAPGVMYDGTGDQYCIHCHDDPGAYPDQRWPCPTIRALDGVVP